MFCEGDFFVFVLFCFESGQTNVVGGGQMYEGDKRCHEGANKRVKWTNGV